MNITSYVIGSIVKFLVLGTILSSCEIISQQSHEEEPSNSVTDDSPSEFQAIMALASQNTAGPPTSLIVDKGYASIGVNGENAKSCWAFYKADRTSGGRVLCGKSKIPRAALLKNGFKTGQMIALAKDGNKIAPPAVAALSLVSEFSELEITNPDPSAVVVTTNSSITIEGTCDFSQVRMKVKVGNAEAVSSANPSCENDQNLTFKFENVSIPVGQSKIIVSGIDKELDDAGFAEFGESTAEFTVNRLEPLDETNCDLTFNQNTSFAQFNRFIRQVGDKNGDGMTKACIAGGVEIYNRVPETDNCLTPGSLLIPESGNEGRRCYIGFEVPSINNLWIHGLDAMNRPRFIASDGQMVFNRFAKLYDGTNSGNLLSQFGPITGFRLDNVVIQQRENSDKLNKFENVGIDWITNVKIDAGVVTRSALTLTDSPTKLLKDLEITITGERLGLGWNEQPHGIETSGRPATGYDVELADHLTITLPGGPALLGNFGRITNSQLTVFHSINPLYRNWYTSGIAGYVDLLDHSTLNVGLGPNPQEHGVRALADWSTFHKIEDSTINAVGRSTAPTNSSELVSMYRSPSYAVEFNTLPLHNGSLHELKNVKMKVTGPAVHGLWASDLEGYYMENTVNPQGLENFSKNGNSVEILGTGYAIAQTCPLDLNDLNTAPYGTPGCFEDYFNYALTETEIGSNYCEGTKCYLYYHTTQTGPGNLSGFKLALSSNGSTPPENCVSSAGVTVYSNDQLKPNFYGSFNETINRTISGAGGSLATRYDSNPVESSGGHFPLPNFNPALTYKGRICTIYGADSLHTERITKGATFTFAKP